MIILVSDTSVLIDLERGGLLEGAFSLGYSMVVPDLLYERELETENGPYLKGLGLGVLALTAEEVSFAQQVRSERNMLSLPDCFALSCATRAGYVLVTGDGNLRAEAEVRVGRVYGVLWILDQLLEKGVATKKQLFDGLTRIHAHPRCRLPHSPVKARLKAWSEE
jgi:hypothetical protein